MWLTGKLAPDFKTIADFRRDNGAAIRVVCRQFVILCREIGLIAGGTVAVDGSRFKAVNTRDKNYTPGAIRLRMEQLDASITRYLGMLDTADRQEDEVAEMRISRLSERLKVLRRQMRELQTMEREVADAPDHQVSLTDPDARAMATNGRGTGIVGYNVQAAVDAKHHLIVAHDVTNVGHDRSQLANMARQSKEVTRADGLTILADRGYFSGEEVVACEAAGVTPIVPKPLTSGAKADGRFGKQDFIYQPETDTGAGPLPNTKAGQRRNRDEPPRPRLQPETGSRCPRRFRTDSCNPRMRTGSAVSVQTGIALRPEPTCFHTASVESCHSVEAVIRRCSADRRDRQPVVACRSRYDRAERSVPTKVRK